MESLLNRSQFQIRKIIPETLQNTELRVYNVLGREVYCLEHKDGPASGLMKMDIDLSGQPAGVYLFRVVTGNTAVSRRIVVIE